MSPGCQGHVWWEKHGNPTSELNHLLLEIDKAMRADSNRLIRAVDSMEPGNVDGAAALGHAFSVIVHNIHEHHWAEDDLFYPFLIERIEGFEADVVRLEDDHVDLDAMARINARFRLLSHPLSPGLWEVIHSHLATTWPPSRRCSPATSTGRRPLSSPRSRPSSPTRPTPSRSGR